MLKLVVCFVSGSRISCMTVSFHLQSLSGRHLSYASLGTLLFPRALRQEK